MSIRLKLVLGSMVFLLLFVAVFVASTIVTGGQKTDGLVINIAARQRTLAEKMNKELIAYAGEPSDPNWNEFATTRRLFAGSLAALTQGGPVSTTFDPDGSKAHLPKATDAAVRETLGHVEDLYRQFDGAAGRVRTEARDAAAAADSLVAEVPLLIHKWNGIVDRAQVVSEDESLDSIVRSEWSTVIKYASRQRLLVQRLGTMALDYMRRPSEDAEAAIESIADVFEGTHHALLSGGAVVLDPDVPTNGIMIAKADDARIQKRLLDAGDRWERLRNALRSLMLAASSNASALRQATSQSPDILAGMTGVVDRATALSQNRVHIMRLIQISALVAGLILVGVAAFVGHRIGMNMAGAVEAAQTIAEGDLTHRTVVTAKDETGRLQATLNGMVEQLSGLVRQVLLSGVSVGSSSSQIAGNARRQESAVSQLATSATEIAATSTEIAATAEQLLETMNEVGRVSGDASLGAANSKVDLEAMQRTMCQMVESMETVTDRLSAISQKTAKISSVVGTITKIAQQTNLISLNAAIEAENAGELGLGFAVVAKEVRRLADQTTKASTGVEQMVSEMQSAVSTAVMGMDGFEADIRRGSEAVQEVVARLGCIIDQVERLAPRFEAVREGMSAQAEGAHQIAEGVRQIVESSEETAESVRQTNVSITALTHAAGELQEGVRRFKVGGNGTQ
jgi:methyl-accepting chemotaxis protein